MYLWPYSYGRLARRPNTLRRLARSRKNTRIYGPKISGLGFCPSRRRRVASPCVFPSCSFPGGWLSHRFSTADRLHPPASISLSNRSTKWRVSFKLLPPPSQLPKPSKTLRHSRFPYKTRKYSRLARPPRGGGGGVRPLITRWKRNNKKRNL